MELENRINKMLDENAAFTLKDLAVSGKDLIAIGIPAGKEIGVILNTLLDVVIENQKMNTKESLLKLAIKDSKSYLA